MLSSTARLRAWGSGFRRKPTAELTAPVPLSSNTCSTCFLRSLQQPRRHRTIVVIRLGTEPPRREQFSSFTVVPHVKAALP
jgi:hypothetical protein